MINDITSINAGDFVALPLPSQKIIGFHLLDFEKQEGSDNANFN